MPEEVKNCRYVLKYRKGGCAVWISHLDSVRLFSRAFHRAGLDVVYSEGFNPRPRFVFAVPLPLGASSDCELLEFRLTGALPPEEIAGRLSRALPAGITVSAVYEDTPDFSEIAFAEYEFRLNTEDPRDLLSRFLDREKIEILKRTKKGEAIKDIKPGIGALVPENGGFTAALSVTSEFFLGPELFLNAFKAFVLAEQGSEPEISSILRRRFLLADQKTEY